MTSRYAEQFRKISAGGVLLLDGGVSTELERRGAEMKAGSWSGHVALEAWDTLVDTHRAYIDAGSDIITTNTYATSPLMLQDADGPEQVELINLKSIEAAHEARRLSGTPQVMVAGSISHALPFASGAEGAKQQPDLGAETLKAAYDDMVGFHEKGGVDLLLLEMMSLPGRMVPLFEAVKDSDLPVWCGFSARRQAPGEKITSWHDESVEFSDVVGASADYGFDVLGTMHTSADLISDTLPYLKKSHAGPVMVYPDSGYFKAPHWQFENVMTPEEFRDFVQSWISSGVAVVGGCCGLGPEHIAAVADLGGH